MSRNLPLLQLLLYAMDGISLISFREYFIKIKVAQYKFHLTTTVAKVSLVHNMAHFFFIVLKKVPTLMKSMFYVLLCSRNRL